MRAWTLLVLLVGCGEPMRGELHGSIGRPGAGAVSGRVLAIDSDEDDDDWDPTVPLAALEDDGVEAVPYALVVGGRCLVPGVSGVDGHFSSDLPERCRLPAGRRRVELRLVGKRPVFGHVTILPSDRVALVVTSDVDMTYLETRFHSAGEIASLLRAPARRHEPLAGMPELYRRLRARADALRFVSGSPTFFRAHLEARFRLDRIVTDELTLKRMGEILQASWRQPQVVERALREQVGYKIAALLEGRLRLPGVTREVLLGDDTEMDAYAYRLYRDIIEGTLTAEQLIRQLVQLGVGETRRAEIERLLPRVRAWVRPPSTVLLIGIRETDRPNRTHPARRVADPRVVFHRDTATLGAALAARHVL